MRTLQINGKSYQVEVPNHVPLLWVLCDVVGLTATKFGPLGQGRRRICFCGTDSSRSCPTFWSPSLRRKHVR
jgi:aerobic-type carbon monoxide dehydrogenase small subunit (CoxS/CutS family)